MLSEQTLTSRLLRRPRRDYSSSVSAPRRSSGAPHALYVAWGFPPFRGGGAYRSLATTLALLEAGFRVTVLTADREAHHRFSDHDDSLEELIPAGLEVVRVPFTWPTRDFDIRHWTRERAEDPKGWLERYKAHETDDFPERHFGPWRPAIVEAAERIHQASPVDLVIGSANPNVDFAVGDHLHTRYGVPHVMDHRDAWRLDVYTGREVGAEDPRIAAFEGRAMASATEIWFVNEPIRAWHQEAYPFAAERMFVVENGFDDAVRPRPQLEGPAPDAALRFAYLGTIGDRVPMAELVEGWVQAARGCDDLARARADIWGPVPNHNSVPAAILPQAHQYGVHHHGSVPKAAVADVYDQADVLLLVLAAGRYVTSGKVYEYMATGLPILSVHEPTNAASDVLRDYPLWVPVSDLTTDGVAAGLETAARLARSATPEQRSAAVAFGARFERLAQLRPVAARLHAGAVRRGKAVS